MNVRTLVLVAVLVLSLATLGTTSALAADGGTAFSIQENNTTTTPANETTTTNPGDGGTRGVAPNSSQSARVTPVQFEADFLQVTIVKSDSVFNTSGPFAQFVVSEPLEGARIQESPASARVLEGGQTVLVTYDADAAPDPREPSLYHLELFYADGSSAVVELNARRTEVTTEAASLQKYKPLIYKILDDADAADYERNAEGATKHYTNVKEDAELLNSLFTKQAAAALATLIAWVTNPVLLILTLAAFAVAVYYRYRRRGYVLDIIGNDSGRYRRLRETFALAYKRNQQTADEERLEEVERIGPQNEVYWRDAQGVSTVYQLAELARRGRVAEQNGEVKRVHTGITELEAAELEDSWLESVAGSGRNRIASYEIALGHMKTALERMDSKYSMGHLYRDAYERVVQLIDERQTVIREGQLAYTGTAAAEGDD